MSNVSPITTNYPTQCIEVRIQFDYESEPLSVENIQMEVFPTTYGPMDYALPEGYLEVACIQRGAPKPVTIHVIHPIDSYRPMNMPYEYLDRISNHIFMLMEGHIESSELVESVEQPDPWLTQFNVPDSAPTRYKTLNALLCHHNAHYQSVMGVINELHAVGQIEVPLEELLETGRLDWYIGLPAVFVRGVRRQLDHSHEPCPILTELTMRLGNPPPVLDTVLSSS